MNGLTAEHARISKLANDLFDGLTAKLEIAEARVAKLEVLAATVIAWCDDTTGDPGHRIEERLFKVIGAFKEDLTR